MDVNAILLVEIKKKKSKSTITTNKEITKVFPSQEGNPSEVVEASSIQSDMEGRVLTY